MCPMLRSPRNDARPRIAFIGTVASAAARAAALQPRRQPSPPVAQHCKHRNEHVEHGLLAGLRLAARLHRVDRRRECIGDLFRGVTSSASALPSDMNSVP